MTLAHVGKSLLLENGGRGGWGLGGRKRACEGARETQAENRAGNVRETERRKFQEGGNGQQC